MKTKEQILELACPVLFKPNTDVRKAILSAMEEYAKIVAANAFSNGWDRCMTSPITWKESEQKKYLENL